METWQFVLICIVMVPLCAASYIAGYFFAHAVIKGIEKLVRTLRKKVKA